MIKIKKINNNTVQAVPIEATNKEDLKPIKGADIFGEIFCNCFCLAKKKSGKSTLMYKIVKETCDPRTKVFAFVSTLNKDKTWNTIQKYCETKHIEFHGFTSIIDDDTGRNILEELVVKLQKEVPEEAEKPKKKKNFIILNEDSDDEEEKPKRYKYRVPEYLFILDDLSTELSNPAVTSLLKKNRHFSSKVIISNQYWNDLAKSARKNMDYMIIFGAQPKDKLQEIHKELDLSLTFDEFYKIYKYATIKRFSFLYIDVVNEIYRRNFDVQIDLE